MRLDDIKARVAAAQAPDEAWVTEITVQGHHIDLMEHARTDIPDLLRVVEAARGVSDYYGGRHADWCGVTMQVDCDCPRLIIDALADLVR